MAEGEVLPLFRGRFPQERGPPPVASCDSFEPRDARPEVLLDPPMIREELPGGLPSGLGLAGGTYILLTSLAPTGLSLVVPEVEVFVPIDPTHPETTTNPQFDRLLSTSVQR
jgi:hypothetical protein